MMSYEGTLDSLSTADIVQKWCANSEDGAKSVRFYRMSRAEKLSQYKQARKNPKGPVKRLYSIPEAAFYLGRTVDGLREILWSGRLPYVKDEDVCSSTFRTWMTSLKETKCA